MSWQEEWRAISTRIVGFLEASRVYFLSIPVEGSDYHAVSNVAFIPNAKKLYNRINSFVENYSSQLPKDALEVTNELIKNFKPDSYSGIQGVQGAVLLLSEFRSEFEFSISGNVEHAKGLTERAFIHLQRSIVADSEVRKKWIEAFNSGELSCEKLGAVHLLSHGIWAFKAHGIGERTDLVLGEPVALDDVKSSHSILVLTEWKVVCQESMIENQAGQAKSQAERYGLGVLAGFELGSRRYLVLVSEKNLNTPQDIIDGEIIYRHVNIAVNPDTPSRAS